MRLYFFSDRFFIYLVKVDETFEAPDPVSIKAQLFIPSIKMIITKGFVTWLSFAVNVIFEGFSQIEV